MIKMVIIVKFMVDFFSFFLFAFSSRSFSLLQSLLVLTIFGAKYRNESSCISLWRCNCNYTLSCAIFFPCADMNNTCTKCVVGSSTCDNRSFRLFLFFLLFCSLQLKWTEQAQHYYWPSSKIFSQSNLFRLSHIFFFSLLFTVNITSACYFQLLFHFSSTRFWIESMLAMKIQKKLQETRRRRKKRRLRYSMC